MSSIKRIKLTNEVGEDTISTRNDIKHIQDLPNDIFRHCIEFVGTGSFAFVAPVSKHFYWNYINLGVEMKNNVIDVDVILQQGCNKRTTTESITTASGLRLATECFLKAPESFQAEVCRQAAVSGRLDVLKCASILEIEMESAFPNDDDDNDEEEIIHAGNAIIETIANGHLDVVEFLSDHGVRLDYFMLCLDDDDFLNKMRDKCKATSLHWMVSEGIISEHDFLKGNIAKDLARDGEIDILIESYKKYIDQDSLYACAETGNFEAMNSLLQVSDFDFNWTLELFSQAAKSGNIPMMELCLRNGCTTGASICSSAMQNKNHEAALTALKWLYKHGIPWDERVCTYAAVYGNLKALRWARENGCPWNSYTFNYAAQYGHIDILEYCFNDNCPVISTIWYFAVWDYDQLRSLKVYKWLQKHSIPWDGTACLAAARAGQLATLKWAIQNGCPWQDDIFEEASKYYNIDILKYCFQHLSSMDDSVYVFAINKMSKYSCSREMIEVLQIIHDHGIPWNRDIIPCAERLGEKEVADWLRCVGCPH